MNCPKCGKELTEQDGTYLCAGCGARFRKKQPQPAATTPAESAPATKREETPATQSDTAQTPPTAPSTEQPQATTEPTAPVEAQAQAEPASSAPAEEQTSTPPTETAAAPAEGATTNAPQNEEQRRIAELEQKLAKSEEQLRIAELERRLAEMESRQNAPAPKGSGEKGAALKNAVDWVKHHKKPVIIGAVAVVLILAVMIPLLVTFCGVRGVYVNVKKPREYYRFGVSSVEYCENVNDPEMMMEGKYSISGNKITFTIEDEMFGEMSDTSSFQKLDGNKKIQIGDDVYEYVGYSIGGTVTLTFDAKDNSDPTEVEVEMSKRISSMPENPTKSGYNFGGWRVSSDRYFSEYDPVWTDMTLIADWKACTHSAMNCDESICPRCGKAKEDMSEGEVLNLPHTFDALCVCTKCGIENHTYDENSVCSRCGVSNLTVVNGVISKADYLGTTLVIPKNATIIAENAFKDNKTITAVSFAPGSELTSIQRGAFSGCSSLTSVTIPDSVTSIGDYAFNGCPIETANIPAIACSSIKNNALKTVVITGGSSIDSNYFRNCTGLTSVTIGDGITSIGDNAFSGCSSLTSVSIPNSVTSIGKRAFSGCSSLTAVTIPNSVTRIDYSAFYGCSSLTSVTIGNSVTSIGGSSFSGCAGLTSITIPDSVTSIGDYAFSDCSLTSVTIGSGVTSIGRGALGDCPIETATIPAIACPYIKNSALKTVVITSGEGIGQYAFSGCSKLTSVTIPDSVTSIGNYAFSRCTGLTSITIPDSVTSIGTEAFSGCYKLVEVYNKSTLSITNGSTDNGYVGYYAKAIYTEEYVSKLSTTEDGYVLYTDGSSVSLIGYIGTATELTLPDGITEINQYAFYNRGLTSVTIPNSVTSIGEAAFSGCSLTSITIPDSVTRIGGTAFNDCPIKTATIPAFACSFIKNSALKTVVITSGESIARYAFEGCFGLTSITIPNGVTSIGYSAFYNCYKLVEVYNKSTLSITKGSTDNGYVGCYAKAVYTEEYVSKLSTTADGYSLYTDGDMVSLVGYTGTATELTLPAGITEINQGAFYGCSSLTSVTIGNSVTSIGNYAFSGCSKLTSITIPDSVTSIGEWVFSRCSSLTSITIPDSVTSIGQGAFSGCSLTSITIPDSVTSIGGEAFYNCSGLSSITIPDSVTSIDYSAFYGCSSLTSVTIGNSVTSIGHHAFSGCSKLASITIPNSVTSIGDSAFSECSSLTSVTIPDSVTSIGEWVFSRCSSLTSITIGNGVTSIGQDAFYMCTDLTSVTIPNGVTSIGQYAFSMCTDLTSVTIPNSVTSIGYEAFNNCTGLTSITFQGTKAQWNAISKASAWNYNTGNYTIRCTNGNISKSYS